MRPELAGGALLDVGIYPLNFASMVFGDEVDSITGTAVMTETGVDAQNSITITYKDGKMAALCSSAMGLSDRRGIIKSNGRPFLRKFVFGSRKQNNTGTPCLLNIKA